MPFPAHLTAERLVLGRPQPDDLSALTALVGDPRVPETQFPARFRTPELTATTLQLALDHWAQRGFGPWLVRLADGGTLVGRVGLMTNALDGRPCVEAKWFLGPDFWGRGYATEAARPALAHGFADLGLPEIMAWTMTTNTPSQAVMTRLGFAPAGTTDRGGIPHLVFRAVPG